MCVVNLITTEQQRMCMSTGGPRSQKSQFTKFLIVTIFLILYSAHRK